MGKPFVKELTQINNTLDWVKRCDVSEIRRFLVEKHWLNLLCVGSGGSFSACRYAAILYEECCSMAQALTPLEYQFKSTGITDNSKILLLSASGRNNDVKYAYKKALKTSPDKAAYICLRGKSPLNEMKHEFGGIVSLDVNLPNKKDGFLATNSLVGLFSILYRCFYDDFDLTMEDILSDDFSVDFSVFQNFTVLYGQYGEPVAYDIESKMSEAALGTVQLSDFRNFGHGRHHWYAKRKEGSCIIAIVTPKEKLLAQKTLAIMPDDIPIIWMESEIEGPLSSIELLIRSFSFVQKVGGARGIDPGKPGVPEFGTKLYHLNFEKSIRNKQSLDIVDVAIERKCRAYHNIIINKEVYRFYKERLDSFLTKINNTTFNGIAFDYDGTLSGSDYESRFSKELDDKVREELIKLLDHHIPVYIITGRGKSISDLLRKSLPRKYWKIVTIGYYNGGVMGTLDDEEVYRMVCEMKNLSLDPVLNSFYEEFISACHYPLDHGKKDDIGVDKRKIQLSLRSKSYSDEVYEQCQEIIRSNATYSGLRVWRSSHSLDIVVGNVASKRKVLPEGLNTLCIGDSGHYEGNDFEMLSSAYSLSVDKVSRHPEFCWNLAPQQTKGLNATLYYLRQLRLMDETFTCKLKV